METHTQQQDITSSGQQDRRDTLQNMPRAELTALMLKEFPIDRHLIGDKPYPRMGCLRYSLVDVLTRGHVLFAPKRLSLPGTWTFERTAKDVGREDGVVMDQVTR
jgi:hypothetical protein